MRLPIFCTPMKLKNLLPLVALLAGCSHSDPTVAAAPDANISADQKVEQFKNDSTMPEGLKKIKIETLQSQPGTKQ